MGVVYQAVDLELGRVVALKFLEPSGPQPPATRLASAGRPRPRRRSTIPTSAPSTRSASATGGASSPWPSTTARPWPPGSPASRSPLSIADAASIAGQLASALAAAHGAGIVHRDLKPENVMITRDGRVKLLDFGLAKWAEAATVTEKGMVVGTAAYMAPEQLRGENSGVAGDLWAFGVVLYQMLAGERPFGGERKGMVHAIFHEDPPPLRGRRPDIPEALERIVTRCLAKDPAERYPDATAILDELAAAGLWESSSSGSTLFVAPPRARSRGPGAGPGLPPGLPRPSCSWRPGR